jgi:hypothetical protein
VYDAHHLGEHGQNVQSHVVQEIDLDSEIAILMDKEFALKFLTLFLVTNNLAKSNKQVYATH